MKMINRTEFIKRVLDLDEKPNTQYKRDSLIGKLYDDVVVNLPSDIEDPKSEEEAERNIIQLKRDIVKVGELLKSNKKKLIGLKTTRLKQEADKRASESGK